jgi:hypothetical protein
MDINAIESALNTVNIVLYVIFAVVLILGALLGMRRGAIATGVRLGVLILSIILSLVTYGILSKAAAERLGAEIIGGLAEEGAIKDIFEASPTLIDYILFLVRGLAGPASFMAIFSVIYSVLWIVALILTKVLVIGGDKDEQSSASRGIGAGIGAVTALLTAMVWIMPVTNYMYVSADVFDTIVETMAPVQEEGQDEESFNEEQREFAELLQVQSAVHEVQDMFIIKLSSGVTRPIFKVTSTVESKTYGKMYAYDELGVFVNMIPDFVGLSELDLSNLENVDLTAIDNLIDGLGESVWIKAIMAEAFSSAGNKWYNNEEFLGINLKQTLAEQNPAYATVLDSVLLRLADSTKDNVVDLMHDLVSTIESFSKTVAYLNNLNSGGLTLEDLNENLGEVLKGIDQSTVELITPVFDPEVLQTAGLSQGDAEVVSGILTDVLNGVVELSDQEIDEEAEALGTLISYITPDATTAPEPEQIVSSILDSQIVMGAVSSYTESNSAESIDLGAEATAEIQTAINNYQASNPEVSQEDIDALKSLFGITG